MDQPRFPTVTPVVVKYTPGEQVPSAERMGYLLASNGLFQVRNHEFFKSCVAATQAPPELEAQEAYFEPNYPRLGQRSFERVVGFFARIAHLHQSEAGVLLVWDREQERVLVRVPRQVATVRRSWNNHVTAIGLHYEIP